MPQDSLDEREFELINIIGKKLATNQRDLSRHMSLSLGQTNMLIRRLVSKGYIRVSRLSQRRVAYLLTPKGIGEKMRQSVKYTMNTIRSFSLIKSRIKNLFFRLHEEGHREFCVVGQPDLVSIVRQAFTDANLDQARLSVLSSMPEKEVTGLLLVGFVVFDPKSYPSGRSIHLLEELAKNETIHNFTKDAYV